MNKKKFSWKQVIINIVAWTVGLIWIIPFMGILMASIRPQRELIHGWWKLDEVTISFDNFSNAWFHPTAPIGEGIKNSLIVTAPATILPIIIATLAAYGLMRLRFPGRRVLLVGIVLLLSIPQQMVAVPLFQTLLDHDLYEELSDHIAARGRRGRQPGWRKSVPDIYKDNPAFIPTRFGICGCPAIHLGLE